MRQLRTRAIILGRTDYAEADRILLLLTPDNGKLKAIAKGVRRSKSKLAGGIELFSVSDISFIPGRREISTLVSTRLIKHYGNIVKDLDRTNLAFALIKRLDRATEDVPEPEYFYLLEGGFEALNDFNIPSELIDMWFNMQLLRLAGYTPDLRQDAAGRRLDPNKIYTFDFESMKFNPYDQDGFTASHIKFLRLGFSKNDASVLARVKDVGSLVADLRPVVQSMLQAHIRI